LVPADIEKETHPWSYDGDAAPDGASPVEDGILASGCEALAFYKSIHAEKKAPYPGKWGIFLLDYALNYLAREIERHYPGKFPFPVRVAKGRKLLYFHERFHFRFDCWVLAHESVTGRPLYEDYRNSIYRCFHPEDFVYEESLANLHALRAIAREGIATYAKAFMLSQPGAYSNIIGADREEFLGRLAAQTFYGRAQIVGEPHRRPEHVQYIANSKDDRVRDFSCPVYRVIGVSASQFSVPSIALPTLSEIENRFIRAYLNGREGTRTDHRYFTIDNGQKIKGSSGFCVLLS